MCLPNFLSRETFSFHCFYFCLELGIPLFFIYLWYLHSRYFQCWGRYQYTVELDMLQFCTWFLLNVCTFCDLYMSFLKAHLDYDCLRRISAFIPNRDITGLFTAWNMHSNYLRGWHHIMAVVLSRLHHLSETILLYIMFCGSMIASSVENPLHFTLNTSTWIPISHLLLIELYSFCYWTWFNMKKMWLPSTLW